MTNQQLNTLIAKYLFGKEDAEPLDYANDPAACALVKGEFVNRKWEYTIWYYIHDDTYTIEIFADKVYAHAEQENTECRAVALAALRVLGVDVE